MNPNDERLRRTEEELRRCLIDGLAGNADAYQRFLADLAGFLRGFFRRRLPGLPEEVEDLIQETMLAIHIQRRSYDARQPLTAWVHAIARYKLIDLLRRRSRREALTGPLDDASEIFEATDMEEGEARRDLSKLLDRLPARQRLAIAHVKIEGRSVLETAELTGQSVSAVKVNVHRGLKKLAAMIRNER